MFTLPIFKLFKFAARLIENSTDLDFFGRRMSDSSPYGYEKSFGVAVGPCKDDELDPTKIHIIKYIGNGYSVIASFEFYFQ